MEPFLSETSDGGSSDEEMTWIGWFVGLKGNEGLVEIDDEFIRDNFNLFGLRGWVENYDEALEMILSKDCPEEEDINDHEFMETYQSAAELYALIHARFILTVRGLQLIRVKITAKAYGTCPRVLCDDQPCLPLGVGDSIGSGPVMIYCPLCEQTYTPKGKLADVEGAFFGPSFPLMFLLTYPSVKPADIPLYFVPKIFGFKVHKKHSVVLKMLTSKTVQKLPRSKEQVLGTLSRAESDSM